jgi:hypothetical protein
MMGLRKMRVLAGVLLSPSVLALLLCWTVAVSADAQTKGPAAAAEPPANKSAGKLPTRKVPLLGMATTERDTEPAPGLAEGIGLIVQAVAPSTPAAKAGLQRFDVVHLLNEQVLVNNPQFRVLLRTFKAGDTIELAILRDGRPMSVKVKLGEAEIPVVEPPVMDVQWVLSPAHRLDSIPGSSGFQAKYEDRQHVLTLRTDEKGKHLLAKNREGAVLFDGTINTTEDRKKLPEDLRAKVERLELPPKPQSPGQ